MRSRLNTKKHITKFGKVKKTSDIMTKMKPSNFKVKNLRRI